MLAAQLQETRLELAAMTSEAKGFREFRGLRSRGIAFRVLGSALGV